MTQDPHRFLLAAVASLAACAWPVQGSQASGGELWFPFAAIVCVTQSPEHAELPGGKALRSSAQYQQWREALGATNASCIVSKQAASAALCTAVLSNDPTQPFDRQAISRLYERLQPDIQKLEVWRECQ